MKKLLPVLAVIILATVIHASALSLPRKILMEICTSTTCSPCYAPDNFYFYQWLPNYGGADQIITLAYHVWWPTPGNDPMYLANTAPIQTRMTYYNNIGSNGYVPRAYIDGFIDGTSAYNTWPGAIEGRFLDPSPISITLSGTRSGNDLIMNAAIYAGMSVNSSNWRVHWVVVQDGISEPQNSPNGYVPFVHHAVHRTMLPDANGSAITITQGQTVNIPRTITLGTGWIANDCKVIVFVQNNTDKKVQNAEVINVGVLTDVEDSGTGIPSEFALTQNFPNPFNPSTTIKYALSEKSFVSLKIYNMLGEEVRTLVSQDRTAGFHETQWDGRGNDGREVPSGVYLYQMTAGKFSEARKMILLK